MTDAITPDAGTYLATDGYPLHVLTWPPADRSRPIGRVVLVHGVQSHGGWYHNLGRQLAGAGFEAVFPDRRGSGANRRERGHSPSAGRLIADLTGLIDDLAAREPNVPLAVAGISWGGKLALVAAAERPETVRAVALICPGLHPKVGLGAWDRVRVAWALLTGRAARTTFPIPLIDPALFTANPRGQDFIRRDPLGLRVGTAGLMASSFFLDRAVARVPKRVKQPCLLMLAGLDRIVENTQTLQSFQNLASAQKSVIEYPEGHHTLEFDPDPDRYARDLAGWLASALGP